MTYRAERTSERVRATVDGKPLPLRLDLWNHSPTGFEWGYGGSGPAQLALAILARHAGDEVAVAWHQQFKWEFLAEAPTDMPFEVASDQIDDWLAKRGVEVVR